MTVDLSNFASLFEIGFAVHIAVALLERIYARELPVRLERIGSRINALERFRENILKASMKREGGGLEHQLKLASGIILNPVWLKRNDDLIEKLHALRHDSARRLETLRKTLMALMFLSVLVVLYSVTMLFLIGFQIEALLTLNAWHASLLVLAQLLPLPLAAAMFYFRAHRMSLEVDRKLRGAGELRVSLTSEDKPNEIVYASIEEIVRSDELAVRLQTYRSPDTNLST